MMRGTTPEGIPWLADWKDRRRLLVGWECQRCGTFRNASLFPAGPVTQRETWSIVFDFVDGQRGCPTCRPAMDHFSAAIVQPPAD